MDRMQPDGAPTSGGEGSALRHEVPRRIAYAPSGDANIAYEICGGGSLDLVLVRGYATHIDLSWEWPGFQLLMKRLSLFARVIRFDKRGTGLSDPAEDVPTLEQRMDDLRAVMNAAGSEEAVIWGFSEGGAMAMLFAASHPERTKALVLYSTMGRTTRAPDYPWVGDERDLRASLRELIVPRWGDGTNIEVWAPSLADDAEAIQAWGRYERQAASPGMFSKLNKMFFDVDVRHVLSTIRVPTLVLHRRGDRVVNVHNGRYVAEHIPGARYVELDGIDHAVEAGDTAAVIDEVEAFLTGVRRRPDPDRVLATLMFTDIVASTEHLSALGDARWRDVLAAHERVIRDQVTAYSGEVIKSTGDGLLAMFDGPARAVLCGRAVVQAVQRLGLDVRVGLHAGEVERLHGDLGGIGVHIAARVADLAGPREVLVSETVKGIVAGSDITFQHRGDHALKGVPERWRIYAVVE